jgi:hypothetical protein
MPASRSRTQEWRRSLEELRDKGGSLEVAVARDDARGHDLVWRLRIIDVRDDGIVVENPGALGRALPLHVGTRLVAYIVIGQNRCGLARSHWRARLGRDDGLGLHCVHLPASCAR